MRARTAQLVLVGTTLVALASDHGWPAERYEFSRGAMGTEFRLVLYAADPTVAGAAARAAFDRVEALERLMSDYRADSELTALSLTAGSGRRVPVTIDTWQVLTESETVARATGGAFDITVGPLTRLWRRAARRQRLPDPERLVAALAAVGYDGLRLDPEGRTATLVRPGMRLDLGGVAKGYAIDQAFELLRARGMERILVDGGGDLRLGEPPPGTRGWQVSVPARGPNGELAWRTREVSRTAVATSGPSARSLVVDGVRYSHVIDPRTGQGITTDRWVTVFAPTATRADALASALSVLGDSGRMTARRLGATEISVIEPGTAGTAAGETHATTGEPRHGS